MISLSISQQLEIVDILQSICNGYRCSSVIPDVQTHREIRLVFRKHDKKMLSCQKNETTMHTHCHIACPESVVHKSLQVHLLISVSILETTIVKHWRI